MTIAQEAKKSATSGLVELFQLDLTLLGGTILYFTPNTVAGASAVVFGTQTYQPLPVKSEGWETSIDGAPPRPTLTISNVTRFIQSFLTSYADCVGAKLTRTLTMEKYLASGSAPDSSQVLFSDVYIIEQKKSQNQKEVVFVLASVLDNPMRTIPNWKILRPEFPGAGLARSR
jgi:lambda family phage minor tail protein L